MNQSPSLLAQPEEATALVAAPIGILDGSDDLLAPSPRSDVGITSPPSSPMKSVSLRDLGVMQVPTANHYASRSGKVQCIMSERDGGNKIVLSYQLENGTEVPVLMALRQKTVKVLPKYHLFDISADGNTHAKLTKEDPQYLGKVRRDKNIRIHAFALSVPVKDVGLDDSAEETYEQSMYVLYELPSLTSVLLRKDPPRRAQVAVYSEPADVNGLGNRLAHMVSASKKATGHLDNVSDPASGLFAFANKEPYKKANGDLALNFEGRCRRASPSNMIIESDSGEVLLTCAKWDSKQYNVDFKEPFTTFQAFAFAVAQICDY